MDSSDYIGKKFARLTVVRLVDNFIEYGKPRTAYLCLCDCGTELIVTRHRLQNKNGIKSCGCLNQENRSKLGLNRRIFEPHISSARTIHCNSYSDGNLLFEDFFQLSQMNCHYCNAKPKNLFNKFIHREKYSKNSKFAIENGNFIYNGLDRVDSSKPHNVDNVVPCCYQCNAAKSDHSIEKFREWICKVYEFWAKEKV